MRLNRIWRVVRVFSFRLYGQHNPMITAGSYPPISIDFGKDEPGMTLQYRDANNGQIVWLDYTVDGKAVKSPVDIDVLPFAKYRLRP